MIKRTVEVGLLVTGKERLAEGFAPEVMLRFAVIWLKRDRVYRGTEPGAGVRSVEITL